MTGSDVVRVIRDLYFEHGRFPTIEEFAEAVGVEPNVQLEVHLLQIKRSLDILIRRLEREGAG
jgi:hypothetical protein